ncbi:energy transducer TonB [Pelomicrobium sp.]|jgi:protein TonB|uniref:energy transducer TonB n=1 Tax=Pelomicrobium sp. TaxID=2815319 RepID=UPI002FDECF17
MDIFSPRTSLFTFGLVLLLHVAFLYALQSGLARDLAQRVLPKVMYAEIIAPPVPQPPPPLSPRPPEVVHKPRIVQPATPPMADPEPSERAISPPEAPAIVAPTSEPVAMSAPPAPPAPLTPVTPPRFDAAYLNNPAPDYPALARRMGEEGRVLLRVLVTADGRASQVKLHATSGSARLDEAAARAVAQWRFVPARQGDQPVDAWVLVPVVFKLQ